jgi:hypothetical protein
MKNKASLTMYNQNYQGTNSLEKQATQGLEKVSQHWLSQEPV